MTTQHDVSLQANSVCLCERGQHVYMFIHVQVSGIAKHCVSLACCSSPGSVGSQTALYCLSLHTSAVDLLCWLLSCSCAPLLLAPPHHHPPCTVFYSELIRKFIELKRRHEKLYRMCRYQEKLIADLEQVCCLCVSK